MKILLAFLTLFISTTAIAEQFTYTARNVRFQSLVGLIGQYELIGDATIVLDPQAPGIEIRGTFPVVTATRDGSREFSSARLRVSSSGYPNQIRSGRDPETGDFDLFVFVGGRIDFLGGSPFTINLMHGARVAVSEGQLNFNFAGENFSNTGQVVPGGVRSESQPVTANPANCAIVSSGKRKTMELQSNCATSSPILIPDGYKFDGKGYMLTVIDPPSARFDGAVLRNVGKSAHIANLAIRSNTGARCGAEGDRLTGISFDRASGTVSNVDVSLGAQESNRLCLGEVGIDVKSLPPSRKDPRQRVSIRLSEVNFNLGTGVLARGNVDLKVESSKFRNHINVGPAIALEARDQAKATFFDNDLIDHVANSNLEHTSRGILLTGAGPSTILMNRLNRNDVGIEVNGGTKIVIKDNKVFNSTSDGIRVDDLNAVAAISNSILSNESSMNGGDGISLQSLSGLVTKNVVKSNLTESNAIAGISCEGSTNKVQRNTSALNGQFDIADYGSGNIFSGNQFSTSTGGAVDCPAP